MHLARDLSMLRRRDLAELPESHPAFQKMQTESIPHPVPIQSLSQEQPESAHPQN
jgi:hypothetical protein